MINLIVKSDYDGFFEAWSSRVKEELEKKSSTIKEIVVTSGPYRSYGMSYSLNKDKTRLELDFYSAVRTGFGSIGCTPQELVEELMS